MLSFVPIVASLLATSAFGNAAAIPQKRGVVSQAVSDASGTILSALGVLAGTNANSNAAQAWIGTGGDYTAEFENTSGDNVTLVVWGSAGSWVNVNKPLITYELASADSLSLSFASGASGAWAAIYQDTQLVNGQVSETWGEYTFDGQFSTFDVSREVNMNGHSMSIETDGCTSDMTTCVFQCLGDATSCWQEYELSNCATGSQPGAEYGTYDGAASGGCLVGSNNHVKTTLG